VFLSRASLSLASGRTHLEFVLEPGPAATLAGRLADVGLPANVRLRRGRGVVTWKSTERVGSFLRGIGGGSALLELEVRQVARSMRGDMNRVLNAESANLQRAVAAASRQLAAIDMLEADGRLGGQPYVVRAVAAARRETPEATLAELAERTELTRSAVQRALVRMERLAFDPADPGVADDAAGVARGPGRRGPSGRIPRRCARSSSPRTGRCTPRLATRVSSRP
jgi:DNA-binding protein WhiA